MSRVDSLVARLPVHLRTEWDDVFNLPELTARGLRVLAALLVGWIAWRSLKGVLRRIEKSLGTPDPATLSAHEQRTRTLIGLVRSMGLVMIAVLVLFMVLGAVGVELGPLLAGAGVVGLAISFGAQSLVKDIISGLFILFENQFGVGDVIRLDTAVSGAVERMTLRVVVLRDTYGVVHVVPNGEIKRVSNLTRTWARAVIDIGVAYREDVDHVIAVLGDVGREIYEDPQWKPLLLEPVQVPGVESFGDSAVVIRLLAKTLPLKQWDVARELRRRIKQRFDREGIEIPFPHRAVTWTDGGPPRPPARPSSGPANASAPAVAVSTATDAGGAATAADDLPPETAGDAGSEGHTSDESHDAPDVSREAM